MLKLVSSNKLGEQDSDYRKFAAQTHFDYTKDLDALAGAADDGREAFLLRGRFDRSSLRKYATESGGHCSGEVCGVLSRESGRWTSFQFVQPDVLALDVGQDEPFTAGMHERVPVEMPSPDPVWVQFSSKLLKHPAELPLPLQILVVSVQSARPVILSVAASEDGIKTGFLLKVRATFPNAAAADTIRNQMERETKALSLALAKQEPKPDPKDLTGLLASGTFQAANNQLLGRWVVGPEFLQLLQ